MARVFRLMLLDILEVFFCFFFKNLQRFNRNKNDSILNVVSFFIYKKEKNPEKTPIFFRDLNVLHLLQTSYLKVLLTLNYSCCKTLNLWNNKYLIFLHTKFFPTLNFSIWSNNLLNLHSGQSIVIITTFRLFSLPFFFRRPSIHANFREFRTETFFF